LYPALKNRERGLATPYKKRVAKSKLNLLLWLLAGAIPSKSCQPKARAFFNTAFSYHYAAI